MDDGSDVRPGDLITVPFRNSKLPALVISVSETSHVAERTRGLSGLSSLVRFPALLVPILQRSAIRVFESQPTVLSAWLRHIPKKLKQTVDIPPPGVKRLGPDISEHVVRRAERIKKYLNDSKGRTLILTPWKDRAEALSKYLRAPLLHSDLPPGAAWKNWTEFAETRNATLITTRLGAWLATFADRVIIDEPENDDYKQDELSPRLDARWLLETLNEYRPSIQHISIGTTPRLACNADSVPEHVPDIDVPISSEVLSRRSRSEIRDLTESALARIETALAQKKPCLIIHPIRGDLARITCWDCDWSAECSACGFGLSKAGDQAVCRRCGRKQPLPLECPLCHGTQLTKSRRGKARLAAKLAEKYTSPLLKVVDLGEWHKLSPPRSALIVVTDITLISGYVEDLRRRERLVIAWRRLAALVSITGGEIFIQGTEELINQAKHWLSGMSLKTIWQTECQEREKFGYPPAKQLIKIIVDRVELIDFQNKLTEKLPKNWQIRGPFEVPYRPKSRQPRQVFHLLPPSKTTEREIQNVLEPLAKDGIIDLDPIAFFS